MERTARKIIIVLIVSVLMGSLVQSTSTETETRQTARSLDDLEMGMNVSKAASASFLGEAAGDKASGCVGVGDASGGPIRRCTRSPSPILHPKIIAIRR